MNLDFANGYEEANVENKSDRLYLLFLEETDEFNPFFYCFSLF
ncbi:hypothetical protein X874_15320 [Mannheimia varigena USDA-ARS-USMARC-1312]|nr:hypothetical protein X874_15320 [Mannheimia varigena USDA-ARS-USMARC-1312]